MVASLMVECMHHIDPIPSMNDSGLDEVVELVSAALAYSASRSELPVPVAGTRADAARRLLAAVQQLPELRGTDLPTIPESAIRRAANLQELVHAFEDAPDEHEARLIAQELAARARSLQSRHPEQEQECARVIRWLTATVSNRGFFILGLARSHQADWDALALRARRASEQAVADRHRTVAAPQGPAATPRRAAPLKSVGRVTAPRLELPQLRERLATGSSVAVVGGAGRQRVRDDVKARTGVDVSWIETEAGQGMGLVMSVAERLRAASFAGLIIVEGAISHRASAAVLQAARASETPIAYAKKGGLNQILQALSELDERLSPAPKTQPAA